MFPIVATIIIFGPSSLWDEFGCQVQLLLENTGSRVLPPIKRRPKSIMNTAIKQKREDENIRWRKNCKPTRVITTATPTTHYYSDYYLVNTLKGTNNSALSRSPHGYITRNMHHNKCALDALLSTAGGTTGPIK
jgi:hypothetical protein